jgi:hypothetical protein
MALSPTLLFVFLFSKVVAQNSSNFTASFSILENVDALNPTSMAFPASVALSDPSVNSPLISFIFGGITRFSPETTTMFGDNNTVYSSDAWIFEDSLFSWQSVSVPSGSSWPAPRAAHTAARVNTSNSALSVIIFGGYGSTVPLSDTWEFIFVVSNSATSLNLTTFTLTSVTQLVPPTYPSARYGHSSIAFGTSVFVACGFDGSHTSLGDLWRMDLPSRSWTLVLNDLSIRRAFAYISIFQQNQLLLTGGWQDTNSIPLNDTWSIDVRDPLPSWVSEGTGVAFAAGASMSLYLNGSYFPIIVWGSAFSANNTFDSSSFVETNLTAYIFLSGSWTLCQFSNLDQGFVVPVVGFASFFGGTSLYVYGGLNTYQESIAAGLFCGMMWIVSNRTSIFGTCVLYDCHFRFLPKGVAACSLPRYRELLVAGS